MPRASFYNRAKARVTKINKTLPEQIRAVIDEFPTYGVRRIWAVLRSLLEIKVNRKAVHRMIKINGWQKRQRHIGHRPPVKGPRYVTHRSNQLWAVDSTTVFCGRSGWCYLTAVIDSYDREIVGWRLNDSGRADVAAGALEDALHARGLRTGKNSLTLRSANSLVFGAKLFVTVVNRYGLNQEYITPYTT